MKFYEEFKLQKNCELNLLIKTFLGLVEMMFGRLVNVTFSLPEWQAVKMTSFAPCNVVLEYYFWCQSILTSIVPLISAPFVVVVKLTVLF